jgi:predicted RNase H-like HicB family nuclease
MRTRNHAQELVNRDAFKRRLQAPPASKTTTGGNSARQRGQGTRAGHFEPYTQEGRIAMRVTRYPVIIEQTSTGYSAYCPDVLGCAAVGDTVQETSHRSQDALAAHFDAMREVGEPIPQPVTSIEYVEVAA